VLLRKAVQDKVLELRSSGKIEILDEDLKKLQAAAEERRKQVDAQGNVSPSSTGGTVQQSTGKSNKSDAE
jgi:hypothetical protein